MCPVARRTQVFLKEFVVLFGYLNGIWVAVGVNPGATLLRVLEGYFERLFSGELVDTLFALVPLLFLIAMLVIIFRKGGWLGLAAVALAFLAGMQILSAPATSLVLLLVALGAGFVATK